MCKMEQEKMILEPSFLAEGQESKRNIKNLSFWVEQFLARITRITRILYAIIIALPTLAPCNPCLIYTLGKKLMTHPYLFVGIFLSGGVSEIRRFHASLALEFSREIIW